MPQFVREVPIQQQTDPLQTLLQSRALKQQQEQMGRQEQREERKLQMQESEFDQKQVSAKLDEAKKKSVEDARILKAIESLPEGSKQSAFLLMSDRLSEDARKLMTDSTGRISYNSERSSLIQNLAEQLGKPELTSFQKDLQFAFQGDVEKQREVAGRTLEKKAEPSAPLVVIGDEKEERKKIAGVQAKRFEKIIDRGEAARDALDNINQLESIDVQTGALEPAKASIAAVVSGLGFKDLASGIADVSSAEAFQGVSNRMVNDVLNRAKGPQTEGDAQRAKSTLASLGNTPEANKFMNASLKALALRQIEQAEFIENRMEVESESFSKANKAWNKFKKSTPSLSSVIRTPDGLPMFFYQFKEHAKTVRPGITDKEIVEAWRRKHGR